MYSWNFKQIVQYRDMLYAFRLFLVYTWFFIASAFIFFLFCFRPFDLRNAIFWCRVVPPVARKILNLKFEIKNHDRFKEFHPCVYVANHQHALDLIIFAETIIMPTTALGKKELKYIPFYGWLFWLSGQIMIDRSNREKAIQAVDIAAAQALEKNASIWVFPEGTRSKGKEMGQFKKGAFHLSLSMKRPILPLVCNTFHTTVNFNKWNPGKVVIQVMDPVYPDQYSLESIDNFISEVRNRMMNQIQKLDLDLITAKV